MIASRRDASFSKSGGNSGARLPDAPDAAGVDGWGGAISSGVGNGFGWAWQGLRCRDI